MTKQTIVGRIDEIKTLDDQLDEKLQEAQAVLFPILAALRPDGPNRNEYIAEAGDLLLTNKSDLLVTTHGADYGCVCCYEIPWCVLVSDDPLRAAHEYRERNAREIEERVKRDRIAQLKRELATLEGTGS